MNEMEKEALIVRLNALSTGDKLAPVKTPTTKPAEQEPVGEVVEVAQCYDERWTAIIETGSVELQKGDKVYTTPQPDGTGRDWSLLEATQESLREHMAIIQKDTALLRQALGALEKAHHAMQADMAQEMIEDAIAAMRDRLGEKT